MAAAQVPINRIDLVSYDIHSHEGLDQTIQNLSNIEEVFNRISSKVDVKLQQTKNKLKQLEERRAICMRKIETLAGLNVALTIYSPAKYIKPYKFEEASLKQALFYDLYLKPHIPRIDMNMVFQNQHSNEELGRAPDVLNLYLYISSLIAYRSDLRNTPILLICYMSVLNKKWNYLKVIMLFKM